MFPPIKVGDIVAGILKRLIVGVTLLWLAGIKSFLREAFFLAVR